MWTDALRRWNGRDVTGTMPRSSVGWIGSSSSRRRGVFRKSVPTQRLQSIPTWHAKDYWSLIMRGGAIRDVPCRSHPRRGVLKTAVARFDGRVMAWYAQAHECPLLTT